MGEARHRLKRSVYRIGDAFDDDAGEIVGRSAVQIAIERQRRTAAEPLPTARFVTHRAGAVIDARPDTKRRVAVRW